MMHPTCTFTEWFGMAAGPGILPPRSPQAVRAFAEIDLSALPEPSRSAVIEAAAAEVQRSLDLSCGPLLRVVHFCPGRRRARAVDVIHHLVVDGFSWRVLLGDLHLGCQQLCRGERVALPRPERLLRRLGAAALGIWPLWSGGPRRWTTGGPPRAGVSCPCRSTVRPALWRTSTPKPRRASFRWCSRRRKPRLCCTSFRRSTTRA